MTSILTMTVVLTAAMALALWWRRRRVLTPRRRLDLGALSQRWLAEQDRGEER